MILTCPACATRYLVDPNAIGPTGRQVRCARCSHSWSQPPADEPPAKRDTLPVTPPPAPTDRPRPIPAGSNLPAIRQERRSNWAGWTALGIAVAGLAIAVVGGRERIVTLWPPAKPFYQMVGLWQEPNIVVAEVKNSVGTAEGGGKTVQIEISVVNRGNAAGPVPTLVVALRDDKDRSVATWMIPPDDTLLKPGEARLIRTSGNAAPGAQSVAVTPAPR
jgi:predicted Zn finger-like uncharacterized protein